jgi:hypothetical protein
MLKTHFTRGQFERAARDLGVELAAVIAVAEVEAGEHGPFVEGRPTLLFERHLFHRFTAGRFGITDLSNPDPGGYGKVAAQWGRLERAMKLDEEAARRAASVGCWQILGDNHVAAGYPQLPGEKTRLPALRRYYEAMQDPAAQLAAFVAFVKAKGLSAPLRTRNWLTFARVYNGPKQRGYDAKILAAFNVAKERIRAGGW